MSEYKSKKYKDNEDNTEVIAKQLDKEGSFVVTKTARHGTYQYIFLNKEFQSRFSLITEENKTYDFSDALRALEQGKRIHRLNWNGNNQWVILINPGNAMHTSTEGSFDMQKCFGLKNAQNKMQPGWIPSTGDLLAKDWVIKE